MRDDTTEADGPTRRLTIEDVATAAGVSVATVSRAPSLAVPEAR